jgi:hypothetical protein
MALNAGVLFPGAMLHGIISIGSFQEQFIMPDTIAEAICDVSLVWGRPLSSGCVNSGGKDVTRTRRPGATGYQESECRNDTHPEPPSAAGQVPDNEPFLSVYLSREFSLPDLAAPALPMNTLLDGVVFGSAVTSFDFALNCAMTVFEVPT